MGTKFDTDTQTWTAFFSKRHPINKKPKSYKRIGLKSQAEAKRVERDLVVKINNYFQEQTVPTWAVLVAEFLASKQHGDWTDKTLQNAKLCLEAHTFDKWGKRKVDSITTQEIKMLLKEQVGERSKGTQQTLLKFIRGAFVYAVECRYVSASPAPNIRFKINDKIKMVLTEAQVRILLEKAKEFNSPWYYHWCLALYLGCRNGELYALTWDRVNFETHTILINSSWNKVDGFKDTKSGDDRLVEVAPTLLTVLKELRLSQFDSNFVLPRMRAWDKGEQARELRFFLRGLGLPEVTFHNLRATWATIMLSKGVEPIKVMGMGGWRSLKTMQIYIRKAGVDIKGISNVLELHEPSKTEAKVFSIGGGQAQARPELV